MSTLTSQESNAAMVPDDVCTAIRGAKHVALIGHVTPDADALASMGALWLALPELGAHPYLILPADCVSRQLQYLVSYAGLKPATPSDVQHCDLVVALDTAKERRLNAKDHLSQLAGIPVLNIDHHATNTNFGQWNWVVGNSSSTSELVYELLRTLGCQVTPTMATLLYAGLHTDTQGFSLSNTGPHTLKVGYELALAGAAMHEICERMHRSQSRGEFDLLSVVYRNTRISDDGRVAWSSATHEEIAATGCDASDIDDQVEIPRSIEGISVAVLFTEGNPGKIRLNFRGEQGISVLKLAQQFGGGGHHASAGARLEGTIEDITPKVVAAAIEFVAGLSSKEIE